MRVGQNPAKSIDYVKKPENITVAIITYIPFLSGYYKQSLEILKICLNSLWENTNLPFDLMVFDNASCKDVTEYLLEMQSTGKIQYLTLSDKNIGKGGGWNFIFNAAPGKYIAYADADIQFIENWLVESLKIIETFPNVGMVTGRPLRTPEEHYSAVLKWAKSDTDVQINEDVHLNLDAHMEHTISLGKTEEVSLEWYGNKKDYLIEYKNVEALTGAAHFQFLSHKDTLQKFLPFEMDKPMGQVRQLDADLNTAGFLRLCLLNPLVRHLGNKLVNEFSQKNQRVYKKNGFYNNRIIKKILMVIYDNIFSVYYEKSL